MKDQIIACMRELNLPKGEYCVFGGASLAIRNLRYTSDIDLYVTDKLYEALKSKSWEEVSIEGHSPYLKTVVNDMEVEAFLGADPEQKWQPKVQKYLAEPEIIEEFPFMPLKELYEWKANVRRPKDVKDLAIIEKYWATNNITVEPR